MASSDETGVAMACPSCDVPPHGTDTGGVRGSGPVGGKGHGPVGMRERPGASRTTS